MGKPALKLILAAPRGFCAGVVRAVDIVERALSQAHGGPVYVRHEIVHNRQVVERLERLGAIFVEELDEVPDDAMVVFSAHGVPKAVGAEAERRKLSYLDATCPLVSKVHHEAERLFSEGRTTILIGHAGHPEVIGTLGQLPPGAVVLVQNLDDIDRLPFERGDQLAFITQTTLSVDDTAEIVAKLRRRYPEIVGPRKEDICYATSNRQAAVKAIAERCDAILVIGSANSSNSQRLAEVALKAGCKIARLISGAGAIDWPALAGIERLGLTAGASAPEDLVQEVIAALRERYDVKLEEVSVIAENVHFRLPRALEA